MAMIRPMTLSDLNNVSNINFDVLTETFSTLFYAQYFTNYPECCVVAETAAGRILGYMIGKVEGSDLSWHGHVSAVTVAVEARRAGIARLLMDYLEEVSANQDCFFVDLFVRVSNTLAVEMYKKLGYVVFRRLQGYYCGSEDAFDMRKPLRRDLKLKCLEGASEIPVAFSGDGL
eukprot:Platyproteum_vivax@DN1317_c0_g1_i1.p1